MRLSRTACASSGLHLEVYPFGSQPTEHLVHGLLSRCQSLGIQGQQRTEQHVAAGTRAGVDPPHRLRHRAFRAMRAACTAAPKPLSMLTTVPGAQELSMASRAASPPKDAPYPTDGRHRHQGHARESADHAGQRAPHAGHHHQRIRLIEVFADGQQSVQPGHAHIADRVDLGAEHPSGRGGFRGDGRSEVPAQTTKTCPDSFWKRTEHSGTADGIEADLRKAVPQCAGGAVVHPGGQHSTVGVRLLQRRHYVDGLVGRLALREHDLGSPVRCARWVSTRAKPRSMSGSRMSATIQAAAGPWSAVMPKPHARRDFAAQ